MDTFIYYAALLLVVVTGGYGMILVGISAFQIVYALAFSADGRSVTLNALHLLNGIVNILVAGILYWQLEISVFSSLLTIAVVCIFSTLEGFARRYYSRLLETN